MSDNLPPMWPIEAHTKVKHDILKRYLEAWLAILTRQAKKVSEKLNNRFTREILFIDGFAGPGRYSGGEEGSPLISLRSAFDHQLEFPIPVRLLFIEKDPERFKILQSEIKPFIEKLKSSQNVRAVDPIEGDCDEVLTKILDDYDQKKIEFGPALAFLDQFGYAAVSMSLIKRILSYGECEVFTYLSFKEMDRWISDKNKSEAFTRAFGGDEWKPSVDLPYRERRESLLKAYKSALKNRANAKYVVSFLMFDQSSKPLYWLVFCTNNLRGLEEMKKAMWFVDKTGGFRFSDREEPAQLDLLDKSFSQEWLQEELAQRLVGRKLKVSEIKEFVLVETPCYLFKEALGVLERQEILKVVSAPEGRRLGDFIDSQQSSIEVSFPKRLFP